MKAESKEPNEIGKEVFWEHLSDELLSIYKELSGLSFVPEILTADRSASVCDKLEALKLEAANSGDEAKERLLGILWSSFYVLGTVGTIENPKEFQNSASAAFDLLKCSLLALDDSVPKNKGKIIEMLRLESDN